MRSHSVRGLHSLRRSCLALAAAVLLPLTACDDEPTGASRTASLDIAPRFQQVAGPDADPARLVDALRIHLARQDETTVVDSVVTWPTDQDTLRVRLTLDDVDDGESFLFLVEARIGAQTAFRGDGSVEIDGGGASSQLSPELRYVGPGADAAWLFIGETPSSILAGDTLRLFPWVYDSTETQIEDAPVVWTSLDTLAATVDAEGLVTAGLRLDRTATIVARVAFTEVANTLRLGLRPAAVRITPESHTLEAPGDTVRLTATALGVGDVEATGATFTWSSSNTQVARVDQTGLVTAMAAGTATISADTGGVTGSAEIVVGEPFTPDAPPIEVVTGDAHTCVLDSFGNAVCWGSNEYGQLGDGTDVPESSRAVLVEGVQVFRTLSASNGYHTCGITTADEVYCWGANFSGQLGDGTYTDSNTAVRVESDLAFHSVTAGLDHSCGLTTDGRAYCWGYAEYLGGAAEESSPTPVEVTGGHRWSQLSAGAMHTCGLTTTGEAYCWGDGSYGQLGNGTDLGSDTPVPVAADGLAFASISTGWAHTCALTAEGEAYCWGYNNGGQVGDGQGEEGTDVYAPVPVVDGGLTFDRISAGTYHTCAVALDGTAYCWGTNYYGHLGDGTEDASGTPVPVRGGHAFQFVSAGYEHSCGLTLREEFYCWGDGANGERGDGEAERSARPVEIEGDRTYTDLGASQGHACAIASDGSTWCWGSNTSSQLGDGTTTPSNVPVALDAAIQYDSVTVGGYHTCAVDNDLVAYCWGRNAWGQVGDSSLVDPRPTPSPVSGGSSWQSIRAGILHTCGVDFRGIGYCWGYNDGGQLGDGGFSNGFAPTPVATQLTFRLISAGDSHSCGLATDGSAHCWGWAILGDGENSPEPQTTPWPVAGRLTFMDISAGWDHTCGVDIEGVAYCWGTGGDGKLGTGGTAEELAPAPVAGGHRFVSIRTGRRHTCALTSDDEAYCWGRNSYGQLGDGTFDDALAPVPVAGGLRFRKIAVGEQHTCGLALDGRVYCWGANGFDGALGAGWSSYRTVPVRVEIVLEV